MSGKWTEDANRTIYENDGHIMIVTGKPEERTRDILEQALIKHGIATLLPLALKPNERLEIRFHVHNGILKTGKIRILEHDNTELEASTNGLLPSV